MRLAIVSIGFLSIASLADGGEPAKRSAELQVLDRFVGSWETSVTIKATGATFKTTQNRRWSKAGTFLLSEDMNLTSKKEAHFLITYDPRAKTYRSCFIEEENAIVLLGTWDNKTQTMTWAGDSHGVKHAGTYRFLDNDHIEWSLTVTGPEGQVFADFSAKQERKRKN